MAKWRLGWLSSISSRGGRLLRLEPLALPWQRIVGVGGEIKLRGAGTAEQRLRLQMEGVSFRGRRVDMKKYEHPLRPWDILGKTLNRGSPQSICILRHHQASIEICRTEESSSSPVESCIAGV